MIGRDRLDDLYRSALPLARRPEVVSAAAGAVCVIATMIGLALWSGDEVDHGALVNHVTTTEAVEPTDPFLIGLRDGYRALAEKAQLRARFGMSSDFTIMSEEVTRQGPRSLEEPSGVIDGAARKDAQAWRRMLEQMFIDGMRDAAPEAAARAQVAYECIVRAGYGDGDVAMREECIEELRRALSAANLGGRRVERAAQPEITSARPVGMSFAAISQATPPVAALPPSTSATGVSVDPFATRSAALAVAEIETGAIETAAAETADKPAPKAARKPEKPAAPRAPARSAEKPFKSIYFDPGAAALDINDTVVLGDVARAAIERAAAGDRVVIRVVGHADAVGHRDENEALSEQRANVAGDRIVAVLDRQIKDPSLRGRITVEIAYFGESRPAVRRGDGVGAQGNRRVELYLSSSQPS